MQKGGHAQLIEIHRCKQAFLSNIDLNYFKSQITIIFRIIGMNQLTILIHSSHVFQHIKVALVPLFLRQFNIFQFRGRHHIFSDELHKQNIAFDQERFWTNHSGLFNSLQVSVFFFSPELDHFSGISFAVAMSETKLPFHITFSVFENQNGSFVNLDGKFFILVILSVIDVGFFSS